MARITPSALVDDIKGSVGGVTFSSWKGMSYVKAKAKSVRNPATNAQVAVRTAMTFFSRRFFDDLTDEQRAAWDQYAQEVASAERSDQVQGGFGARIVPQRQFQRSGYNWYIAINVRLVKALGVAHYGAPIDDAPLGQTPPTQPTWNGMEYLPALGKFTINLVAPQSFGHATSVIIAVWALPNYAYAREQQAWGSSTPGEAIGPNEFAYIYVQRARLVPPLPDGLYAFQMDCVGVQNGLVSPPSSVIKVAAKYAPV